MQSGEGFEAQGNCRVKLQRISGFIGGSPVESRFFESSIFRTMARFPWICFSQTLQFYPRFFEPRFFETPDFSNQFLPPLEEIYKKFTFDFSNPHKILKLPLSSFHLNGFTSQTQKVQPPSITQ